MKRMSEKKMTPDVIQNIARGFQQSRILLSAFELEIFTVLEDGVISSKDVALKLSTNEKATDRLLNALCAMELVDKNNGLFSNSETASSFLVKGKKDYMGGLGHIAHLFQTWSRLTDVVKDKDGLIRKKNISDRHNDWIIPFIEAMHGRAVMSAPLIVKQIDLDVVKKVLDVGGGSGAFAMSFVRQRDDISATVFDLPSVIPLTKKYVENEGLTERISFSEGDYTVNEFEKGFDLLFLSAIIHSNSPKVNQQLVNKCFRALNPGGKIVIVDFIMDENRVTPPFGAFFALNMLVGTEEGDTFTEKEVREWMTNAGFADIQRFENPGPTSAISGRKK